MNEIETACNLIKEAIIDLDEQTCNARYVREHMLHSISYMNRGLIKSAIRTLIKCLSCEMPQSVREEICKAELILLEEF